MVYLQSHGDGNGYQRHTDDVLRNDENLAEHHLVFELETTLYHINGLEMKHKQGWQQTGNN